MTLTIYHNPRCAKSRNGLKYLRTVAGDFTIVEYLKDGIDMEDLKNIILKMNVKPIDLVRTNEDLYKKELKGRNFTDEEWLKIIVENPRLLRRPLVAGKYKAVLADPVENINELISK